jgi:hypothetical protein
MIESFFLESENSGPRLKIGVLIDDVRLIRPFSAVLDHIARSNFARLALVIRNECPPAPELPHERPQRYLAILGDPARRRTLFYAKYEAWDRTKHPAESDQLEEVDCSQLLAGVPQIAVTPIKKGFVHRFPAADVATIRSYDLDVILRFGFNILRGEVLSSARCGVWSYHHGDNDRFRGGPALFWELTEKAPLSGTILQVLNEELDAGMALAKTLAPTALGLSLVRNAVGPFRSAETMVIWKLKQLHQDGWDAVCAGAVPPQPYQGKQRIYRTPTNLQVTRFIAGELAAKVGRRLTRDGRFRHWKTGLRRKTGQPPWTGDWKDFSWIESPPGHFYADPFLVEHDARTWLFVEDFDYRTDRGGIACAEVHTDGSVSPMRPVLAPPHHLSFPFVFQQDGVHYMIPEAHASGRTELWRAEEFPYRWVLDHVLLDKPGIDTVLHVGEDNTHYWLTSFLPAAGAHPVLFLFYSDGLRIPWRLHPSSPLTMDARYSRNGGALIQQNGALVRTSQDPTLWYGRQMHFHRIDRLDRRNYSETLVGLRALTCGPDVVGTHTYTHSAQWEATDALWLTAPAQKG